MPRRLALLAAAICVLGLLAPAHAWAGRPKGPDATVSEGSAASIKVSYRVPAGKKKAKVTFRTVDGTATAGADYTAMSGKLTFTHRKKTRVVTVPTSTDLLIEGDETFTLALAAGARRAAISVRIVDATHAPPPGPCPVVAPPAASLTGGGTVSETSGSVPFTVQLSSPTPVQVGIHYATADGTATAGSDYTAASGTLVFAPCQTTKTFDVGLIDDPDPEAPTEDFTVALDSPVNATVAGSPATVSITSDETLAVVSASRLPGQDKVVVTFNHSINPATVFPDGSQFTFDHGLVATSVGPPAASNTTFVVSTGAIVAATGYTVTVAGSVVDVYGNPVDPAHQSVQFTG